MNNVVIRRFEMFRRVRDFGAARVDSFAPKSLARELFDIVSSVVVELQEAAAAHTAAGGSARQSTAGKAATRAELRESLEAISRTARAMDYTSTGIEEKFRLPRKASDQVLLNTARAFAAEAEPLKDEFVRHELQPDFIDNLKADIADFERAIQGQNTGNEARQSARQSIDTAVERGMNAVRRLHPLILNKFRFDAPTLAAWESARHVERPARPKPEENKTEPAPPPQ